MRCKRNNNYSLFINKRMGGLVGKLFMKGEKK